MQEQDKARNFVRYDLGFKPKFKKSARLEKSLSMPNIIAVRPVESADSGSIGTVEVKAFDSPKVPIKSKQQQQIYIINNMEIHNRLNKLDAKAFGGARKVSRTWTCSRLRYVHNLSLSDGRLLINMNFLSLSSSFKRHHDASTFSAKFRSHHTTVISNRWTKSFVCAHNLKVRRRMSCLMDICRERFSPLIHLPRPLFLVSDS